MWTAPSLSESDQYCCTLHYGTYSLRPAVLFWWAGQEGERRIRLDTMDSYPCQTPECMRFKSDRSIQIKHVTSAFQLDKIHIRIGLYTMVAMLVSSIYYVHNWLRLCSFSSHREKITAECGQASCPVHSHKKYGWPARLMGTFVGKMFQLDSDLNSEILKVHQIRRVFPQTSPSE